MKNSIIFSLLIFGQLSAFCQESKNAPGHQPPDSVKLKIKQIDDYVLTVDKDPNLIMADHIYGELANCGGYTDSKTYINRVSKEKIKTVENETSVNYYKNNKLIYYRQGNYFHPVTKRFYLQNNQVIFIDDVVGPEILLKISFSIEGGGEGVIRSSSYNITKDTVNVYVTDVVKRKTKHKVETRKAFQIWQSLVNNVNIDGIDKIRNTCETAPVDGRDYHYIIQSNYGFYHFINPDTNGYPHIADFFRRIDSLNLYKLLK
jgi:hypothetical protein